MKVSKYFLLLFLLTLSGCSTATVGEEWVNLLSTNGLAVVFAMFCIFVILPAVGCTLWRMTTWIGKRVDKLVDAHYGWMERLVASNEEINLKIAPLHSLVESLHNLTETESVWHRTKFEKLMDMHNDIEIAAKEIKEIHREVLSKIKKAS
jgi:hypothetical protein